MVTERIGMKEAQQSLLELGERVQREEARFIVERDEEPVFVLLGYQDYEELLEIRAEQSDSAFQASLRKARTEIEAGEGYTHEQVLQMLNEWETEEVVQEAA
jgi:PHD/YefM family antitoxin component YafN of YafNO toxin-antitoxin module